jgi:hypothetical protein
LIIEKPLLINMHFFHQIQEVLVRSNFTQTMIFVALDVCRHECRFDGAGEALD